MSENNKRNKRKYVVVFVIVIIAALAGTTAYYGMNRATIEKLSHYVKNGEYEKVVKAYNRQVSGNIAREEKYNKKIENLISDIVLSWSSEELTEDDAIGALDTLSGIDNNDLSKAADDSRSFIVVESESDKLFETAEDQFEAGNYLDSLKTLASIDNSYTQYDFVNESKKECEEILVAQISYPTSIEEYEECEKRADEYLAVTNAQAFKDKKKQLEIEHDDFVEVAPSIEKARALFDEKKYMGSFDILEIATDKYPDNRFAKETLGEFHNMFVVATAMEIKTYIDKATKEDNKDYYDDALEIVKSAREIYDCEELKSAQTYITEQKYWPIKAKNNLVRSITSAFNRWTAEDYDVKEVGSDAGAYIVKSGKKIALGDYDEGNVTLLSVSGEVATSLVGVDMALDARDLSYDVTHWGEGEYFALRLATDAVALVPVVGAVKYLKYSKEASKGVKSGAKTAKAVIGGTTDAAKATNRILDNSTDAAKNADQAVSINKVLFKRYKRIQTLNQDLAGKVHPITGVPFKKVKLKYSDGRKIKGVFPVFDSRIDIQLPRGLYKASEKNQKKWLAEHLKIMAKNGKLDGRFNKKEIDSIMDGRIPDGYVWNHSEREGMMQMVDKEIHDKTAHTGGMHLWGKGYKNR